MYVVLRDARPGEGRRFEEIRVAGWRAAYGDLLDPGFLSTYGVEDERIARREMWLTDPPPGEVMLVAEVDGVVLGGALLLPARDEDLSGAAELAALYVDPAAWYGGLGSALLAAGFDRMPEPLQVLWVLEGNAPARRFYERQRFVPDGSRKVLERPGLPPEVRYRRLRTG